MSSEKTHKRKLYALAEAAEKIHGERLIVINNPEQVTIQWKRPNITFALINKFGRKIEITMDNRYCRT